MLRVLIIEDDERVATYMAKKFKQAGDIVVVKKLSPLALLDLPRYDRVVLWRIVHKAPCAFIPTAPLLQY